MQINVTTTGLLNPGGLRAWTLARQKQNIANVREGMVAARPQLKALIQGTAARAFNVKRKAFLNAFRAKLWERDKTRFPEIQMGVARSVPWIGIQETGGAISGRMVIPLLKEGQRISRKKFAGLLDTLKRGGFLFFKREGDRTLVFSTNTSATQLRQFKSAQRERGGKQQRGAPILIGVIVSRVNLRARFGFKGIIGKGAKIVATEIQEAIDRNGE